MKNHRYYKYNPIKDDYVHDFHKTSIPIEYIRRLISLYKRIKSYKTNASNIFK
jgi:hypothetical protein